MMQRSSYFHVNGQEAISFYGWTKPLMCSFKVQFLAYLQYICEGEEMPGGGLVYRYNFNKKQCYYSIKDILLEGQPPFFIEKQLFCQ